MLSLLFIDDDTREVGILSQALSGYNVIGCSSGAEGLQKLADSAIDLVLLDLHLPDMDGFTVLRHLQEFNVDRPRISGVPVIILSAFGNPDNVVKAIHLGAEDFVEKPYTLARLTQAIEKALFPIPSRNGMGESLGEKTPLLMSSPTAEETDRAAGTSPRTQTVGRVGKNGGEDPLEKFVGSSKRVQLLKTRLRLYASNSEPVLLIGESGTGKEILARALHALSPRRRGPFKALNTGALPESLVESELYGTASGAFTDAVPRPGWFEQADGGTLFLDEIGEMPPAAQVKMLRLLEERALTRVGGRRRICIDTRVVCATNKPIHKMVKKGTFRHDLYHRINTLTISIPPLRERMEDIPEIALFFFQQEGVGPSRVSQNIMEKLLRWSWPGNVRELKNTIKRAVVLANGGVIKAKHIILSEELLGDPPVDDILPNSVSRKV
ncbi:MAG: sigma-54-dependent transcriptional regulator [Spirochaetaceae bacterium]